MSRLSCCFASLSLVVVCCSQGAGYSLTECNNQNNFDIVENHETSITCSGLVTWRHVHWTVSGPGTSDVETSVGICTECYQLPCDSACSTSDANYYISREATFSTLQFKNNVHVNNGAVVKCSNGAKSLQASCNINVIKAYRLDNCINNKVDVVVNKETTIRCSGLDASHNMYWKASDLNGFSINIAECGLCPSTGSCPQCTILNDHFRVTRSGKSSDLQIVDQDRLKDGWTITCSKKDNATQDQCKIRVKYYHMPQCQNGTLQIWETQPQTPILCEGLTFVDNMNWMIANNNGIPDQIAFCSDGFSWYKCFKNDTDFSALRTVTVSQLVIQNYVRDKVVNKTLICVRRDRAREDSCRIRVVYPAEISRRNVTLIGWNVTATVVIDKVFDSDRDVVCLWNMTGPNSIQLIQYQSPKLSPLAEEADSPMYDHGACSVPIPVNATEGVYRVFLTVTPAGGPFAVGSVTLKKPGPLLRLQACPQYIAEGSNLECLCRHAVSVEGSPPARVTWFNHDDTPVLGTNHDVTTVPRTNHDDTSVLNISSVSREQHGTTYTCRSTWGPNNDVTENRNYTVLVAYGPTSANVTSEANVTEATQHITLTCTAYDVYPSANFTWSVPCLTLDLTSPVSTCTLAKETLREATEVVCLAINTAVPVLNASDVYTAPVLNKLQNKGNGDGGSLGSVVGGSITAVVVIAVIVVVVVIIVFRRKDKTYERPRRRRGIPEHTYSDLYPDNNTAPQPLNTAPNTSQNTAHNTAHNAADNAADSTAFNTAPNTAPDTAPATETGRVYVNTRSDGASGGAVYYNETSDTQTAPSTDGQDADHYYSEVTDLPPVELNGHAALTREADPGMNMSLYEEIK